MVHLILCMGKTYLDLPEWWRWKFSYDEEFTMLHGNGIDLNSENEEDEEIFNSLNEDEKLTITTSLYHHYYIENIVGF